MKTQATLFAVLGGAAALDLSKIYRSWGYMSTYGENADDFFGVQYTGLPDGCQVVRLLEYLNKSSELSC